MKKNLDVAVRLLILAILIFNAVMPTPVAAQTGTPPTPTAPATDKPVERKLPSQPAVYYTPAKMSQPMQAELLPTKPGPKVPPRAAKPTLAFQIQAETNSIGLNQPVLLTVTVQNNGSTPLKDLKFVDFLQNGFVYVAGNCVGCNLATYNSRLKTIEYTIKSLDAGKSISFGYKVKSTIQKQKTAKGELQIHAVRLNTSNGQKTYAQVSFLVGSSLPKKSYIAPFQTKGGWHKLGPFSVYLEKGAVAADSLLVAIPVDASKRRKGKDQAASGPAFQFELKVIKTGRLLKNTEGIAEMDQAVEIQNDEEIPFESPAYLEVDLTGVVDLTEIPAGKAVYVVTYDEENQVWVQIPIVDQDPETDTVTVRTNHFSYWGSGLGDTLPQNGAQVMLFDQPYTSLFTGAARYSIPVWMPAGRAGMTPSVSLSYSSSGVDGVLGDIQAPWVGTGWNMDGIEVVRKIKTDVNGYGYKNDFRLSLNGASYDLIEDENHPGRYYVKQDGFLYIERHNCTLKNNDSCEDTNGILTAKNKTGEYWEVVTTDGRRYELGNTFDSEQLALMYGYNCSAGGLACTTPNGAYGPLGYAGIAKGFVAFRWRVNQVKDVHGNYMTYTYDEYQPSDGVTFKFDRESYLKKIDYTGFDNGATTLSTKYQVRFWTTERLGDTPYTFNSFDNFDEKMLDKIQICYGSCGELPNGSPSGVNVVRTYQFGYAVIGDSIANGALTLKSLQITGGGFTSSNAGLVPTTNGARIDFNYFNLPNRAPYASANVFKYPRLASIENGYGGKLNYTYGNDGHSGPNGTSWYNYRVKQVNVDSGVGTDYAAIRSYEYTDPVYGDLNETDDSLGALTGYKTVTESTLDFDQSTVLQKTQHNFVTAGIDTGKELTTITMDADDLALRKTVNSYVTDNSKAPFPGWTYRYLGQVQNYQLSGGALKLVSKTSYTNDPGTGNLLLQQDYMGSSLYRKTYYEYITNPDPDVYILDKVSRAVRVDANNQIFADSYSYYDSFVDGQQGALTKGDLVVSRTMTGDGNQTVDSWTSYNRYGLPIASRAYVANGTLGAALSGGYLQTKTDYDDIDDLHQYPIKSYNPLNQISETDYIYEMGIPYKTTDLNGWVSRSTYDGLGRKLSVTPPGLSQPGVWFDYPNLTNGQVAAPYAVQMQIFDQPASTYRSIWGIYDGMGRILQNQVYDADRNQLIVTDTGFNALGSVNRQGMPHPEPGVGGMYISPDWAFYQTSTLYDALGRATQVTAPGGIISKMEYDGLTTISIDPDKHQKASETDAFGRLIEVREYTGVKDSTSDPITLYSTTQYSYDPADRLLKVTDADANVTLLTYNWLGQKTGMRDPDMGTWTYNYDAVGSMTDQTDARGCKTTLDYTDQLHRLRTKTFSDCVDTHNVVYYYDDSTPGQIGMRSKMTDGSGETSWAYADYGRSVTETRTIGINDGITNTFTSTSDWLGRALTRQNPGGETITYSYDALGQAKGLNRDSVTLASLTYDTLGRITKTALGNGVNINNGYDNGTLRLLTRKADTGTDTPKLMNFSYNYTDGGNIQDVTDGMRGEKIEYTYDELNRLKTAKDMAGATTVYNQTFAYDPIGNILSVNNLTLPTAQPTTTSTKTATATPTKTASPTVTQTPVQGGALPVDNTFNVNYRIPAPAFLLDTVTPTRTPTAVVINTLQNTSTPSKTFTRTPMTQTATVTQTVTKSNTPAATATTTPYAYLSMHGYWSFNSVTGVSVPDDSQDAHTGTLSSTAAIYDDASPYLYLNGSRAWMQTLPDTTNLNPVNGFTLSARFNYQKAATTGEATPDAIPTSGVAVANLISLGGKTVLRLRSGYLELSYTTGTTPAVLRGPMLTANGWNTVTITYDSVNQWVRMYVNGTQAASQRAYGVLVSGGGDIIVGDFAAYASLRYQGGIDDVRFYNRPLTETEIGYMTNAQPTPTRNPTRSTAVFTPTVTRTPLPTKTSTPIAGATSTPTLLPASADKPWGTGSDGILSVAAGVTFNINNNASNGRSCADGVAYQVIQLYGDTAVLNPTPEAGCLMLNDEVILINLQGVTDGHGNTGRYEFLRVKSVSDNKVIFNRLKTHFYGFGAMDDTYIGAGPGLQRVMLQRVPNYTNVINAGTITANAWNGTMGGLLAFRASGTINGGVIRVDGAGFRGGPGGPDNGDDDGGPGEGYAVSSTGSYPGGYGAGVGGVGGNPENVETGASGGYGSVGSSTNNDRMGGVIYGDAGLERLYLGAGGGGGGETQRDDNPDLDGGNGGAGGGIIFIAGNTFNYSGAIRADGDGTGPGGASGGSGAGGSIRIEANTVSALGALLASGGGSGRVALYTTSGNLSQAPGSSNPAYQLYNRSTYLTPTLTPQPTSINLNDFYGSGADGDLTIAANVPFYIDKEGKNATDGCADGGDAVAYRLTGLTVSSATLHIKPGEGCLEPGDEFMLINLQGISGNQANVGNYEFLHVGSVSGQTVYFTSPATKYYGEDAGANGNIGLSAGKQLVALIRVPNYKNVTIDGALTTSSFEPTTSIAEKGIGGIIVFRVAGILQGDGDINAGFLGYHGGDDGSGDNCGESYIGYAAYAGGGCDGGGGAYGGDGQDEDINIPGTGGTHYGTTTLQERIYFGSGGGGTGTREGARGGGIVYIAAQTVQKKVGSTQFLSIYAHGEPGVFERGSGAGGSIYLRGDRVAVGLLNINPGTGGSAQGGIGRSAVYYDTSFSLATPPAAAYSEDASPATPTITPTRTTGPTLTVTRTPTVNGQPSTVAYAYNSYRPHAVTSLSNGNNYTYDANGNMKTRTVDGVTTTFAYDGNNRVTSANNPSTSEIYWYDGDGARVAKLVNGTTLTAYFAGGSYEVTATCQTVGTTTTVIAVTGTIKYYSLGGASIMDDNGTLRYMLTDHQGSTVSVLNDDGDAMSHQRYMPFGAVRPDLSGTSNQTDFGYTGQRSMDSIGLMDYNARFYDPELGRFTQPDTIVSNPANPQTWNRYSYVENNPINRVDPTGHWSCDGVPSDALEYCKRENPDYAYGGDKELRKKLDKLEPLPVSDPFERKPVKIIPGITAFLTPEEYKLFLGSDGNIDKFKLYIMVFDAKAASIVAAILFPTQSDMNSPRNAFKHAYWSALMYRHFGSEFAESYGNAHEQNPDNPKDEEFMDLYNNKIGRNIAESTSSLHVDTLIPLIYIAVTRGRMVVTYKGNPYFSNQLPNSYWPKPVTYTYP